MITLDANALTNPLKEGTRTERTPEPCTMFIFGASGDLTRRKIMPSLFSLFKHRLLPAGFSVIGVSSTEWKTDDFRDAIKKALAEFVSPEAAQGPLWESFAQGLFYQTLDFRDAVSYAKLAALTQEVDQSRGTGGNHLIYLATPPSLIGDIVKNLGMVGLSKPVTPKNWTRIIIEKPFGRDYDSATQLNRTVNEYFKERQVYRIDHYLGKETVQNILVFRFANEIFEPIWNHNYIDHVQITAAETVGVEGRGAYYEEAGALRDMIQNHLLQVLSVACIEPPSSFAAESVRDEKIKVFRSIRPILPEQVGQFTVRGQYSEGVISGKRLIGYKDEPSVLKTSTTETYVACKFFIDNWRWAGVPFYVRSGKRLPKRVSEIAVTFKRIPHMLFSNTMADQHEQNVLSMRIQPDEGISLKFGAKLPGQTVRIRSVNMDFLYGSSFGSQSADAYERLILDCMLGDATLFIRNDSVEETWRLITPIHEGWKMQGDAEIPKYSAGTWGPPESDHLLERDGRKWRRL
ncbi:MAG: glucose-6-phosphate dehydrogenase [Rhizobacter sp.]|nr:glucose-6-phosphate dehydrogenase [Chlorobiales bacterium]